MRGLASNVKSNPKKKDFFVEGWKEMDVWNEGGKNRWRYHEGSDQKVIEIELTQGKVALIDAERLGEVQKYKWYIKQERPPYQDNCYATANIPKLVEDKQKYCTTSMHVFLFPEIPAPRDHIDRNGLNNTKANLRNGANGINARNIRTGDRDIGVLSDSVRKSYRTSWAEANGMKKHKDFRWDKYTTKEEAYNAAVTYREENAKRAMDEIIQAQKEGKTIERYKPKPITSNTGRKNICMQYKDGEPYRVLVTVQIEGKRTLKNFSAFQYGGDIDKAISAAQEWLEALKQPTNRKRERDE